MRRVDFKFKIGFEMLASLDEYLTEDSVTTNMLIVEFVRLALTNMELFYESFGRYRSVYELVGFDADIGRSNNRILHVGLEERSYLCIKDMHGRLNNYSIAQIVRRCIFFILELVEEYGSLESAKVVLVKLNRIVTDEKGYTTMRMFVRSIMESISIRQLPKYLRVTFVFIRDFVRVFGLLL